MTVIVTIILGDHSFILEIYIAPLQETYLETLSVQPRPKRNYLRSLKEEDKLVQGSKCSKSRNPFQVDDDIKPAAQAVSVLALRHVVLTETGHCGKLHSDHIHSPLGGV